MRRSWARTGSLPSVMLRPPNPAGGPWGPRALGYGPPVRSHPRGHSSWPVPRARGSEGPGTGSWAMKMGIQGVDTGNLERMALLEKCYG
ncbi:hypothetical protein CapIbe_001926 [Capra ibex]